VTYFSTSAGVVEGGTSGGLFGWAFGDEMKENEERHFDGKMCCESTARPEKGCGSDLLMLH
jgi:hypothetical protein